MYAYMVLYLFHLLSDDIEILNRVSILIYLTVIKFSKDSDITLIPDICTKLEIIIMQKLLI